MCYLNPIDIWCILDKSRWKKPGLSIPIQQLYDIIWYGSLRIIRWCKKNICVQQISQIWRINKDKPASYRIYGEFNICFSPGLFHRCLMWAGYNSGGYLRSAYPTNRYYSVLSVNTVCGISQDVSPVINTTPLQKALTVSLLLGYAIDNYLLYHPIRSMSFLLDLLMTGSQDYSRNFLCRPWKREQDRDHIKLE